MSREETERQQSSMDGLLRQLTEYRDSDYYPFHMPGHKRNMPAQLGGLQETAGLDITEIEGFDNLHQPEGILEDARKRAARVFGAEETLYLVNGSTAGILTAVSAAVPEQGKVIVARNCHKAVYHAIFLRRLQPVYLYPDTVPGTGIADAVSPEQVEEALEENPDACAVILTSPTYDGVVSEIGLIAEAVHRRGIPLIVDAAHGAHFGFAPGWPESPNRQGADLVIQSLHKTLPALTQTALLHVNGSLVNRERVRLFEGIYQTSSPSYVLMASMDACVRLMQEQGREKMEAFLHRLETFRERTKELSVLKIWNEDVRKAGRMKALDPGKLLIGGNHTNLTGNFLYKELLNRYHLQMEMASDTYVTAIVTCQDGEEGLNRLADALLDMDARAAEGLPKDRTEGSSVEKGLPRLTAAVPLHQAIWGEKEDCPLGRAAGKVAGTFVNLYPPGIPLVVPGERLTEEVAGLIDRYVRQGLNVQGVKRIQSGTALGAEVTITLLK